jgi:hypothetical protein
MSSRAVAFIAWPHGNDSEQDAALVRVIGQTITTLCWVTLSALARHLTPMLKDKFGSRQHVINSNDWHLDAACLKPHRIKIRPVPVLPCAT